MSKFQPIREWPKKPIFNTGDTLVIFGEVFERGYVNGIIDEAKSAGVKVIYSTVGRRDENQKLRKLSEEELSSKNQSPLINLPLEAGFDLEPAENGISPADQLKDYGLKGWEDARLDWNSIEDSYRRGTERFRATTAKYMSQLKKMIDPKKNLIFVHTMAGGFPRAKVVMPIANRVFKGIGPRYLSSQVFWESEIGRLCEKSFNAVTAETFKHLIDLSSEIRSEITQNGAQVVYAAYGYHGNEALIGDQYKWYSYSPYLQGFAKCELENISIHSRAKGISATVFNVPEILTNSSSIFLGVEVVLYPLLRALKKEGASSEQVSEITSTCLEKLKPEIKIEDIDKITQDYLAHPLVNSWPKFEGWPQHNSPEQMELMRNASTSLIEMHKDQKNLITADLSEVVFRACGKIMFHKLGQTTEPVLWIGHDAVAKATV
ncbi:MAG: hypothetical protein KDD38_10285 [Bdellovibrionales bacterium]|nr:hypothetical protein [Bdellovibrionales bacterium]